VYPTGFSSGRAARTRARSNIFKLTTARVLCLHADDPAAVVALSGLVQTSARVRELRAVAQVGTALF
jgi:hypothetical protein